MHPNPIISPRPMPRLEGPIGGTLREREMLAQHTSWRVGGEASRFYTPSSIPDLIGFLKTISSAEPLYAIGLGSNILARDGGFPGTVLSFHGGLKAISLIPPDLGGSAAIYVEAGVPCSKLARFAAMHGFVEAEFLATIPGTVGGALAMNAGCYGWETWQFVRRVEVLDREGNLWHRTAADYRIGYRQVKRNGRSAGLNDEWFVAACFLFPRGDGAKARQLIRSLLEKRIQTQPLNFPNAGSVFRNPDGDHAARLIEACGLKGEMIGGAQVSEKHANFIVNPHRTASAADIEALILQVQRVVFAETGIWLEPEVRLLGEEGEAFERT